MPTDRRYRKRRIRPRKPVTLATFASVGWVAADAWHRTVNEVLQKIERDGCWASAKLKPLNRSRNNV